MLNTITHGVPTDTRPLLIVHGLFGSARNWGVIAKRLSDTRQVIAVDMRNHGDSPWMDSHTYRDMADDLATVIADIGAPVDVMGHSMGGKAAMVLALTRPELVRRLIVADIAPVAYSHTQDGPLAAMQGLICQPSHRARTRRRRCRSTPPQLHSCCKVSIWNTNAGNLIWTSLPVT